MIINAISGGGSGAFLEVTSENSGVVTVYNNAVGKTYTKTIQAGTPVVFKGLSTGIWTVEISNNGQTSTKTVEINDDYEITMAFFAAYINVTYPANSNCTITNAGGVVVATDNNPTASAKTFIATVGVEGVYTVTASAIDGSKEKEVNVSIDVDGQTKNVALSYAMYLFKSGEGAKIDFLTYNDRDGTAKITVGTDEITVYAQSSVSGFRTALRSKNTIDFAQYTALKMKCTPTAVYTNIYSSDWENSVGVTATAFTNSESTISWAARSKITASSTEKTIVVDISAVGTSSTTTSLYYFGLQFGGRMTITEIWLE